VEIQKIRLPIILGIVTLGIASSLVFALLSASKTIPSTGNIKAIGVRVYSDSSCTQEVSLIEWQSLDPGGTKNFTVYIRNTGSVVVVLSMTKSNWNPASASSYISLSWNREGYMLSPAASVQAVLTLSVSSTVSGVTSFSFDIIITGTEST
jgi:hypothetical protein